MGGDLVELIGFGGKARVVGAARLSRIGVGGTRALGQLQIARGIVRGDQGAVVPAFGDAQAKDQEDDAERDHGRTREALGDARPHGERGEPGDHADTRSNGGRSTV